MLAYCSWFWLMTLVTMGYGRAMPEIRNRPAQALRMIEDSRGISDHYGRYGYHCTKSMPAFARKESWSDCVKALMSMPEDKPNRRSKKEASLHTFVSHTHDTAPALRWSQPKSIMLGEHGWTWKHGECAINLRLVGDHNVKSSFFHDGYITEKSSWTILHQLAAGIIQHCAQGGRNTAAVSLPAYAAGAGTTGEGSHLQVSVYDSKPHGNPHAATGPVNPKWPTNPWNPWRPLKPSG